MIAPRESGNLARKMIAQAVQQQRVPRPQLTIHADNGSPMTSKLVALEMADLGVVKSHSRPYVSNDNPYSESQFKTLKYRPEFPTGSAASKTPASSVRPSLSGTTTTISTPASPD